MVARMLMVWLLVLNLGVAAWWALHRPASPVTPPALGAAVPVLALVDDAVADAAPAVPPGVDAGAAAPVAAAVPEALPVAAAPATVALTCHSFGPYADAGAAETARSGLGEPDVRASVRRVAASSRTTARGYNVYMPALADREAAQAMATRLRQAGFNDLVVMNQGADANGIALGRFGSEENARRHQADLQAKGFGALVAPVGGVPADAAATAVYWLDVRAPAGFDSAAARSRLRAIGVARC